MTPPAIEALLCDEKIKIDGFLLPGHVCVITGEEPFTFIAEKYHLPAVVAGFEPLDILQAIYMIAKQIHAKDFKIENQYKRVVKTLGNMQAQKIMDLVYKKAPANWRGLGIIENSGLDLTDAFSEFDALKMIPVNKEISKEPAGCRCGEVLRGLVKIALFLARYVHQIMQSVHVWFLLKELVLLGINMVREYFILNKFKNFGGDNIGR